MTTIGMTENLAASVNFARVCRCCVLEHNFMYDVFVGTCSNAQNYYEVVMECAHVQLFRDDGLSSLVCHECVSVLESFVVFRRKCVESESILKQTCRNISPGGRECRVEQIRYRPTLDNIKEESNDEDGTVESESRFDRLGNECPGLKLYDEIKIENTVVNENEIDRRSFENSIHVKEELVECESNKKTHAAEKPYLEQHRSIDASGKSSSQRRRRDDRADERPYACERCEKSFKRRHARDEHRKVHTNQKPYSCDACARSFNYKSNFTEHRKTHTGEKPYACDRCGRSFNRKSNLGEHLKTHTGDKPYACDRCDKSFKRKQTLDEHRQLHTDRKPYGCEKCDKSFLRESNLAEHRNVHTGEKPYSCGTCGKVFARRLYLKRHRIVHTTDTAKANGATTNERFDLQKDSTKEERPHECDRCDRSFKYRSNLNEHRKTHTGEKPYACDTCGRSFSRRQNLERHRTVHTVVKPFTCDVCRKSLTTKSTLDEHRRLHTGERPFRCDACHKTFTTRRKLRRHVDEHHGRP